jgi:chloramphenicol 3-O phosphotransferase
MGKTRAQGQIIILNGAPRSGKSSIVEVIQDTFDGVWMNLGVDGFMQMTPARYLPGIGLRPGGERQDIEPLVPADDLHRWTVLRTSVVADTRPFDYYVEF